ncbi:MAG TPA: EAL domain-containing protein [Burkholderiaceae bacterium]
MMSVDRAAQLEARNLGRSVAHGAAVDRGHLQQHVDALHAEVHSRDIVVVDVDKRGIADADHSEVGRVFDHDTADEVGLTLRDGRPRTFVEKNEHHPDGAMQMAVPVRRDGRGDGEIVGAVIVEYTGIREELLDDALWTMYLAGGAGIACIVLVGLFGARLVASVIGRIQRLQRGVDLVARGDYNTQLAVETHDEIGALVAAFNAMAEDLRVARNRLTREMERERAATQQVEYLAFHDRLTGLPNRSRFSGVLERGLKEAKRYQRELGVFFIDLDRFKDINDTLGHEAGDKLLQEVAARLVSCLRESDCVARLGGDEFVVMLPGSTDRESLTAVAQKILAAIARPFPIHGQNFRVTASVGISVFPADGVDEPTLMKHADIAMYQAKEDGKNNFAFYRAEMNRHSIERLALASHLRHALEVQEFELHYQPKIDCRSGRLTGLEALLRWKHPDLGNVSPAKFIPVAEETGLIVPLGLWVLETACRQHVAWLAQGMAAPAMAVNLSARQFSHPRLLEDVRDVLTRTGMEPGQLELEITESMLMRDVQQATAVLHAFKAMGIRVSVDDFGTGYSSLSTLKRFPVDCIKVDRSFIRDVAHNDEDRAITNAIIAMGKTLGLAVVAEGVERAEQVEFLREHGCDQLQGFFFSRPRAAAEIPALVRKLTLRPGAPATDFADLCDTTFGTTSA